MDDNRRVHARYDDMEIVRYNRAGAWYLEPTLFGLRRQRVSIKTAVQSSKWGCANANGSWTPGLAGGTTFDRMMS